MDPLTFKNIHSDQADLKKAKKLISDSSIEFTTATTEKTSAKDSNNNDFISDFAEACGVSVNFNQKSKSVSIKDEICSYISLLNDPEVKYSFKSFWEANNLSLPILSSMIKKYCITPASSVPSESSFSIANFIQRKERSALSSKFLKYSICLRDLIRIN